MTPAVIEASAGAIEHIAVARVPNLAAAVDELKEKNVWLYAVEADGEPYYGKDFSTGGCAFILGSEGEGVSRLLRDKADFVVSIPMSRRREFAQRVGGGLGRDFRGGAPAAWRGPEELIF